MTKKKPDFLRDLDTAIMDELTGGGIKGNAAGLVGTLTQIKKIKQLCGLPFCGYMAKLETVRPSGVPDEVTVVFAEDVPYRACNGIEFDVMQEFVEGSRLLLTGKVQTLKDFQSGRLLVYILADFVAVSEKAVEQDEAAVRGVIANKPTYRETPRGKRITDITVKVRNELTGGSCFLPCICWQEQADEAAQWQQGDTVELDRNIDYAQQLTRQALEAGLAPITPHLYMTQCMDDKKPEERARGMAAGLALLKDCDFVIAGVKYGITEGMDREIHTANMLGIAVIDANQIKRHLEYEEKRQERAASDYAKLHSCEFCKGSKLYSCTGYDCREPYRRAYEYALSRIRERQET